MHKIATTIGLITLITGLTGCGGGTDTTATAPQPIVSETQTIAEGMQMSYTLPAGAYRAEITSSNNGIIASWVGGSGCSTSTETKVYSGTCTLPSLGQLVIVNPTLLGLGGSEIVTIKVTAL